MTISDSSSGAKALMAMMAVVVQVALMALAALVALLALEDDTRLVVEGREVRLHANELVVFRGDLCHASAAYERCNTRLHVYLDPVGWRPGVTLPVCRT